MGPPRVDAHAARATISIKPITRNSERTAVRAKLSSCSIPKTRSFDSKRSLLSMRKIGNAGGLRLGHRLTSRLEQPAIRLLQSQRSEDSRRICPRVDANSVAPDFHI